MMSDHTVAGPLVGRRVLFIDLHREELDLVPTHEAYATHLANALADAHAVAVLCVSPIRWQGLSDAVRLVSLRRGGRGDTLSLLASGST